MPVMSAQVLMSATALVDTLPGNKPVTWNSGMQTDRNIARKKGELIKEAVPTKLQGSH